MEKPKDIRESMAFARDTGSEMSEKPTGAAMMIRMNALCKWPPEEYKGRGSK